MPNKYLTPEKGLEYLRDLKIKPGETVYTILRHVSASGMTRVIDMAVIRKGQLIRISHLFAAVSTSCTFDRDRSGVKIGGAGMDMGFELVYRLGGYLWPNGTRKPHSMRNGTPDRDGGYALKHSWF